MWQEQLLDEEMYEPESMLSNGLHRPEQTRHNAERFVKEQFVGLVRLVQLIDGVNEESPGKIVWAGRCENLAERARRDP